MSSIDRGKKPKGFSIVEERISELIRLSGSIPPGEVMHLLIRADMDPRCDVAREFRKLLKKHRASHKTLSTF